MLLSTYNLLLNLGTNKLWGLETDRFRIREYDYEILSVVHIDLTIYSEKNVPYSFYVMDTCRHITVSIYTNRKNPASEHFLDESILRDYICILYTVD